MSTTAEGAGAEPVTRRAPFSANPTVGVRGQRTQQRILDAALEVFGEAGYHQCSIDRIAKAAGCSRVSFYQYFAGKEDVFRHLGGTVLRQISEITEGLGPIPPDAAGWASLREWVGRYDEIHQAYAPVFVVFQAALSSDETIAALSRAWLLQPGDLIYTGTPAGVGAVRRGDLMEAAIEGLGGLRVRVV